MYYHGTNSTALESILKVGAIVPYDRSKGKMSRSFLISCPDSVYVTPNLGLARHFALWGIYNSSLNRGSSDIKCVVLEIPDRVVSRRKIPDEHLGGKEVRSFRVRGSIKTFKVLEEFPYDYGRVFNYDFNQ